MSVPKITLKQAEKAVKEYGFKICKKAGYSKKRIKKADKFEKKHGFRYEEVWNLDQAASCWLLPRLVQLRDVGVGFPGYLLPSAELASDKKENKKAMKKWRKILNKMIYGFYLNITKEWYEMTPEEREMVDEGVKLFAENFDQLWD